MDAKICGIKNKKILNQIINHKFPPKFVGFICNYTKSTRYLNFEKLKKLVNIKKSKNIKFVSVLVRPDNSILSKIKDLNFDYYQLYDVSPKETQEIRNKYKVKIITALTIENSKDVQKFKKYKDISEIILFDSKGYEKSLRFDHNLLKNLPSNFTKMIAGNIQHNDNLDKFKEISDIIDLSGSLETQGEKDISKIDIFLRNIKKIQI